MNIFISTTAYKTACSTHLKSIAVQHQWSVSLRLMSHCHSPHPFGLQPLSHRPAGRSHMARKGHVALVDDCGNNGLVGHPPHACEENKIQALTVIIKRELQKVNDFQHSNHIIQLQYSAYHIAAGGFRAGDGRIRPQNPSTRPSLLASPPDIPQYSHGNPAPNDDYS